MIAVANVMRGIALVLDFVLGAYLWMVIGAAVVSWVGADPWNPIVKFLRQATEPVYRRIRRWFPFLSAGGLDFTPVLVIALIYFLQAALVGSLLDYALVLKLR